MSATRSTPQVLFIPGPLPGLNDIIDWSKVRRGAWSLYQKKAAGWHQLIAAEARAQGIHPVTRAFFSFTWIESSRRRDKANVVAGGEKFILDGLRKAGILPNDGWRNVIGSESPGWGVSKSNPGVIVEIHELEES